MKKFDEVKAVIKDKKNKLQTDFGVTSIGIFGSYVRGEQNEESDVDILVDMRDGVTLFDLMALELYLSDLMGKKADVVMRDGLKSRIASQVLSEVVYL